MITKKIRQQVQTQWGCTSFPFSQTTSRREDNLEEIRLLSCRKSQNHFSHLLVGDHHHLLNQLARNGLQKACEEQSTTVTLAHVQESIEELPWLSFALQTIGNPSANTLQKNPPIDMKNNMRPRCAICT